MRKLSLSTAIAVMLVGFSGLSAPTSADSIDLLNQYNVRVDGAAAEDKLGTSVATAGDVNGDGHADVIVGAPNGSSFCGNYPPGSAYVIFGPVSQTRIDLANPLGTNGFRIDGAREGTGCQASDQAGKSVAGAGDVNGDGLDDVIIDAPLTGYNGLTGSAYVIFGKANNTDAVRLADFGTPGNSQGFRIDVDGQGFAPTHLVSGAGDVNGDGRDDVIVGSPFAGNNSRTYSGSAYVVFGNSSPATVYTEEFGQPENHAGFRIDGAAGSTVPEQVGDFAGFSVAGVSDLNGDRRNEVIVGAPNAEGNGRWRSGAAYVIYGRASTVTVDLAQLGSDGYQIGGAVGCNRPPYCVGDLAGDSVSSMDDISGDGRSEILVGATYADNVNRFSGSASVVFGLASPRNIDLADLGVPGNTEGFRIEGASYNDDLGEGIGAAGDVNGDGRPDVIVGATSADNNGRDYSGSVYVVYGKPTVETVDLAVFGSNGFRIDGAAQGDFLGRSVAGAEDLNGDGCDDVIVGAPYADNNGRFESGSAYIVYGCRVVVHADPTCNEQQNPFQVLGLDMDTPDTLEAYQRSSVTGSFRLCGSKIDSAQSYEAGGASVNFVRAEVKMPPGVRRNTQSIPPLTSYVGEMKLDLLTWRGNPRSPIFRANVPLTLRLDAPASDTDCPSDAYPCFKGQTTAEGITGHNWSWITNIGGRLTYVIGEFHNDSGSPAGMTGVNYRLCRYAGNITGGTTAGCGEQEAPHLLTNGDPSAPDCNQGNGPNGIYDVTGYWRNGASTPQTAGSHDCVPWYLRMIRYPGKLLPIDPGKIQPLPPSGRVGKGDKRTPP